MEDYIPNLKQFATLGFCSKHEIIICKSEKIENIYYIAQCQFKNHNFVNVHWQINFLLGLCLKYVVKEIFWF